MSLIACLTSESSQSLTAKKCKESFAPLINSQWIFTDITNDFISLFCKLFFYSL